MYDEERSQGIQFGLGLHRDALRGLCEPVFIALSLRNNICGIFRNRITVPLRNPKSSQSMDTAQAEAGVAVASDRANALQVLHSRPSFFSNLSFLLSGQAGCALLGIATEICYARLLGPAGRGQLSLCMMTIALGVLLGGLGGEIPIIVWLADSKREVSRWLPAVMFLGLLGSSLASGVWVFVYARWHPVFLKGITWPLAIIVLGSIPLTIFDGYLTAMLTGLERFRSRAGISLTDQFTGLVAFVLLIFAFGRTAQAALLGNFVGLLCGAVVAGVLLRSSLRNAWRIGSSRGQMGAALSLGLRGQFANLASFFNYRLDVFVVNYFLNPQQVGLYAVGVVVSEAIWQIPQAAATALTPRTARTIGNGAAEFTCLIMRQVLLISVVSGALLAAICPFVIHAVFGARYDSSVPVIWWILPGTIALALGKVASADFAARSKPEYSAAFSIVALVATAALDFLLIPRLGIEGAALASSAVYLLNSVLLVATLKHQLRVSVKLLLVPRRADFDSYRRAWLLCKSWCEPVFGRVGESR